MKKAKNGKRGRFFWAFVLTVAIAVAAGLNAVASRQNPLTANLQDFGQWLSGVASALAFIWLIVSYFQQGEELELQRDELAATREQLALQKNEMARLADEAEKQAAALQANMQLVQRDIAMKLANLVERSVIDSVALILSRLRRRFGQSASVQIGTAGNYVISFHQTGLEGRDLTFLLRELSSPDPSLRQAWAWAFGSVPETHDDIRRIGIAVDDFRRTTERVGILGLYDQADFMRVAQLLRQVTSN